MKLPRDLSGQDLVKALRRLGYEVSHQAESHIRFTKIVTDILLEPESVTFGNRGFPPVLSPVPSH